MAYSKTRYMELRSRRVPHAMALALAQDVGGGGSVDPADAVDDVVIEAEQDVLSAVDELAGKVNEIILALKAAGLMED